MDLRGAFALPRWSAALEATGRDVWLAISWEIDPDYAAEFSGHANSWRTSMDIDCYCEKLVKWRVPWPGQAHAHAHGPSHAVRVSARVCVCLRVPACMGRGLVADCGSLRLLAACCKMPVSCLAA